MLIARWARQKPRCNPESLSNRVGMTAGAVLGISAFFQDSAACLVRDGSIVAAASEERFTRRKADERFPAQAIEYCLRRGNLKIDDVAHVVFYDKPLLKFERLLETYLAVAPAGFRSFGMAGPMWIKEKLFTDRQIRDGLGGFTGSVLYAEHHESHAASAFLPSPFREAAILTMDGVGEWATASVGIGRDADVTLISELRWPDSLGMLYSAFTSYLGFKINSGEYKVMGLAPYGAPTYATQIFDQLLDLRSDGSFRLDQSYFNYLSGVTTTSEKFHRLFGGPPRAPESPFTQRHMDLARSIQVVTEEIMLRMAHFAHAQTGMDALCLAGGVALNCVGNGRLLRESPFKQLWIQPAAGDAGGALGAALLAWHRHMKQPRRAPTTGDMMQGALLGPSYDDHEIEAELTRLGAVFTNVGLPAAIEEAVVALASEQVVGWFQGRMEFGPRSLGARSILADARSPRMQAQLNLKIKFRESFRPFAPSVLRHRVSDYFELDVDSPYMLLVAPVQKSRQIPETEADAARWGIDRLNVARSEIPAVTHMDYSARVQTVDGVSDPVFHALLTAFEARTGCAVLVNTSFNVRGEPIVCSPEDAYRCFMRTDMDLLIVGPFVLRKQHQPINQESTAWQQQFPLD